MTATRPDVKPRRGPCFERAVRLRIEGTKRRKLVVLLAAFLDAGQVSCRADTLGEIIDVPTRTATALLERLRSDGYVIRTNTKRWRLADRIAEAATNHPHKQEDAPMADTNGGHHVARTSTDHNTRTAPMQGGRAAERVTEIAQAA
jgi:hypothetical protein